MPAGTFFDIAVVHLLTIATINHLRALFPQARSERASKASQPKTRSTAG
jgi:hypothetical protein